MMFTLLAILCLSSITSQSFIKDQSTELFYVSNGFYNESCFVLELSATITVTYKNNKTTAYIQSSQFPSKTMRVNGTCYDQSETMIISWPAINNVSDNWILSLSVLKNDKSYSLNSLNLSIPLRGTFNGDNANGTVELWSDKMNNVLPIGSFFSCSNSFSVDLKGKEAIGKIETKNLKWVSFLRVGTKPFSGSDHACIYDAAANNIVPLVVGGVLAVMVVIVIITYLIGRRRHAANYQTI